MIKSHNTFENAVKSAKRGAKSRTRYIFVSADNSKFYVTNEEFSVRLPTSVPTHRVEYDGTVILM